MSRFDRTIRYGLFLLLGCHVAAGLRMPRLHVSHPYRLLQAPPGRRVCVQRGGQCRRTTRLDLLELLLDEVLEPAARTEFGQGTGCEPALELARRMIALLRKERDPAAIAARLPTSWAIKQHVFDRLLREAGERLPVRRWRASGPAAAGPGLEQLALLSMLEADLAHDQVRNFLLSQIEGAAWSHDDVYGPDPDAISAIAERRPPRGAVSPAAEICRQLRRAAPPTAACELVADWCGVRSLPKDPVAAGGAAVPGGEDPPASATWGRGLDSLLTRIMERLRQQHR